MITVENEEDEEDEENEDLNGQARFLEQIYIKDYKIRQILKGFKGFKESKKCKKSKGYEFNKNFIQPALFNNKAILYILTRNKVINKD